MVVHLYIPYYYIIILSININVISNLFVHGRYHIGINIFIYKLQMGLHFLFKYHYNPLRVDNRTLKFLRSLQLWLLIFNKKFVHRSKYYLILWIKQIILFLFGRSNIDYCLWKSFMRLLIFYKFLKYKLNQVYNDYLQVLNKNAKTLYTHGSHI